MKKIFAALLLSITAANAQGVVKSTHGEWQLRCDTPPGAQSEQCALFQSVTAEDRPNTGMTVVVTKTTDGKSRLMRMIAPLGVLLPSGIGLKIDDLEMGRVGYARCFPTSCVAEVVMDATLTDKLSNGKSATFVIFDTPEEGIGIPVSLSGFKEAFAKLN
jgi:invasion protein IalB